MPTFTAITLARLVEPGQRSSAKKPPPAPVELERTDRPVPSASKKINIPRPYPSPALYATPEVTPLPDSPSSFPPSPYIINHKRRGPRLLKTLSQTNVDGYQSQLRVAVTGKDEAVSEKRDDGVDAMENANLDKELRFSHEQPRLLKVLSHSNVDECQSQLIVDGKDEAVSERNNMTGLYNGSPEDESKIDHDLSSHDEKAIYKSYGISLQQASASGPIGCEDHAQTVPFDTEREVEGDDFFDLNDTTSVSSNVEIDDSNGLERSWNPSTPQGEYFDAFEEITSEGPHSAHRNIEEEIREMRLNLFMEIEGRKQAEEALDNLQNQWQRLSYQLSLVGFKFPAAIVPDETVEKPTIDPAEELYQQVLVARMVADAIGRACSKAEIEREMEPLIESKNFEIARLWDRLHYYEAANKEMSQRNQEAVEMSRQQRYRRKRRQKWFWSSIGVALTLGAAAIAWSYLPSSKPSFLDNDAATSHDQ